MQKREVLLAKIRRIVAVSALLSAIFMVGLGVGLSLNVFLARGVPVIRGGGELLLLLLTPCTFYIGYRLGGGRTKANETDESSETNKNKTIGGIEND